MTTLDILGEDIHERSAAEAIATEWKSVLQEIASQKLNANISVKPSQMGFRIDPEYCYSNPRKLVEQAKGFNNFVRIDMEDSTMTTATIEMYKRLRYEGFDNVGIVIQAYLHTSDADVRGLAKLKANFRLCKGIYRESPDIAYQDRDDIRRNYALLLRTMLETGWKAGDVDLYEINEAFACVTMGAIREIGLDPARVNVNGGACALGHPIGATGTRLIVSLIHALRQRRARRGIAALCIGGGEGLAIALEAC